MKRHRLTVGLVLLLVLAAATPAQQQLKDAFRKWQDTVDAVRRKEKEDFEKIAKDMQRQDERMRPFLMMQEAEILQGENQFLEAAKQAERAAGEFEKKGAEKLTPEDVVAYREALLQSGRLRAVMGDPEQACTWARRAWEAHERLTSALRPAGLEDWTDTAGTSLAVALVLIAGNQPGEAGPFMQRVFEASRHMPEPLRQPERNPLLATAWLLQSMLANSADNYPAARAAAKRAVAAFRALYPPKTHPEGDLRLAGALVNLALAHVAQGELVQAWPLLNEADKILTKHRDKRDEILTNHRGKGAPLRAEVYRIRGHLHLQRREAKEGKEDIDNAREIYQRLFPNDKYPNSHPALIQALTSSADLLNHYGEHKQAIDYAEPAAKHCRKRYPKAHEQHVAVLLSYGRCLRDGGRSAEALRQFTQALAMAHELDRAKPTTSSGLRVALAQIHLGSLLGRQGQYRDAQKLLRDAEAIYQKLSPDGHPQWLAATAYRGTLSLHHGDRDGAREAFASALDLDRRQLRHFARTASEVEALTFTQPRQLVLHGYLSASRDERNLEETAFDHVWASNSAVTRLAEARRAALRLAAETNPEARRLMAKMDAARARLRRDQMTAHGDTSSDLLKEMDQLELELSKYWPEAQKRLDEADKGPRELSARLPRGSAFIDFIRYDEFTERQVVRPRYVAFVLLPGQSARRVELGEAELIDREIRDWRISVDQWKPQSGEAGQAWEKQNEIHSEALRRAVWEPIAERLPADTRLLLLAPDGDLARFPFAALPGSRSGSILLKEFSIAYVPHGPFLLERLLHKEDRSDRPDRFLAIGGVDYGPPRGGPYHDFKRLSGSLGVVELGKRRPAACVLSDREATVDRLLRELRRASEGHIATHCFFDETAWNEDRQRVAQMFRDWTPRVEAPVAHVGLGQRFPLSYVGLVMAGVNETERTGDGILNGELIPPLPLSRLRLMLLDGCDTGLGEYTAGEGVQALARAFHLAGCPNVIATLWHVNDGTAQALMEEFYKQSWENKLPTLEALRQAQLTLFRDPGRVRLVADDRGAPTGKPAERLEIHLPSGGDRIGRTPVQVWGAAYIHSGIGHPFVDPAELVEQVARLESRGETPSPQNTSGGGERASGGTALLGWGLGGAAVLVGGGVLLLRRHRRSVGFPG
jgi:CHAT domain-containing protein